MTSLLAFLCLSSTQESPWGSFFQNAALGSFWAQQWNKKPLQEYLPKISLARCSRKLLAASTTAHKPCRARRKKSLGRCGRTRFGLGVGRLLARCFGKLSALRLQHGSTLPVWLLKSFLSRHKSLSSVGRAWAQEAGGHELKPHRAGSFGAHPAEEVAGGCCRIPSLERCARKPRRCGKVA